MDAQNSRDAVAGTTATTVAATANLEPARKDRWQPVRAAAPERSDRALRDVPREKLGTGWVVKSVSISNGVYIRQPAYGTNDLPFAVRMNVAANKSASAIVTSITLEGPASATTFEDAFRYAK